MKDSEQYVSPKLPIAGEYLVFHGYRCISVPFTSICVVVRHKYLIIVQNVASSPLFKNAHRRIFSTVLYN